MARVWPPVEVTRARELACQKLTTQAKLLENACVPARVDHGGPHTSSLVQPPVACLASRRDCYGLRRAAAAHLHAAEQLLGARALPARGVRLRRVLGGSHLRGASRQLPRLLLRVWPVRPRSGLRVRRGACGARLRAGEALLPRLADRVLRARAWLVRRGQRQLRVHARVARRGVRGIRRIPRTRPRVGVARRVAWRRDAPRPRGDPLVLACARQAQGGRAELALRRAQGGGVRRNTPAPGSAPPAARPCPSPRPPLHTLHTRGESGEAPAHRRRGS